MAENHFRSGLTLESEMGAENLESFLRNVGLEVVTEIYSEVVQGTVGRLANGASGALKLSTLFSSSLAISHPAFGSKPPVWVPSPSVTLSFWHPEINATLSNAAI